MGENLNDNHWHTFNLRRHGNLVKMWVDDLAAKEGTLNLLVLVHRLSQVQTYSWIKCIIFSIPNLSVIFIIAKTGIR